MPRGQQRRRTAICLSTAALTWPTTMAPDDELIPCARDSDSAAVHRDARNVCVPLPDGCEAGRCRLKEHSPINNSGFHSGARCNKEAIWALVPTLLPSHLQKWRTR